MFPGLSISRMDNQTVCDLHRKWAYVAECIQGAMYCARLYHDRISPSTYPYNASTSNGPALYSPKWREGRDRPMTDRFGGCSYTAQLLYVSMQMFQRARLRRRDDPRAVRARTPQWSSEMLDVQGRSPWMPTLLMHVCMHTYNDTHIHTSTHTYIRDIPCVQNKGPVLCNSKCLTAFLPSPLLRALGDEGEDGPTQVTPRLCQVSKRGCQRHGAWTWGTAAGTEACPVSERGRDRVFFLLTCAGESLNLLQREILPSVAVAHPRLTP
jgi:hypothetical protein